MGRPKFVLGRIFLTAILSMAGIWVVYASWPQRTVRYHSYLYSDQEARRLRFYPQAHYAYGMRAWLQQNPEQAARYFRRAVSENVLFFDAWLRLAEAEAVMGHEEKAQDILTFSAMKTESALKWKWPQMLLARELGMDGYFLGNAADLLSGRVLEQDTLQLLHTHFEGEAAAVIAVLEPAHLERYLDWLMRWGMADASRVVWQAMTRVGQPARETALRLAHFLLDHRQVVASADIWREYTGLGGLTNPGFETAITGQGFDWRHLSDPDGRWELKRVDDDAAEGHYALKLTFHGRDNISFYHVYQIFPTHPQNRYRLTYAWKSRALTTDQGLFVEIFGYDAQGWYQAGPMMTATHDWQDHSIEFTAPEACHAAVVRLRRLPSMRFDSKLKGELWIDHLRLERLPTDLKAQPAERKNNS